MIWILAIALAITLIALCFSVYLNIRLGKTILSIEDQIEESLDILDSCYSQIDAIAHTPVLSDDPFVKDVLMRIKASRDAVFLVANKLVNFELNESSKEQNDASSDTE